MDIQTTINGLADYFFDIPTDCPYGLEHMAVYHQGYLGRIPDELMDSFLDAGFRRNGNTLYSMHCPDCKACVPIRLVPQEFVGSRNMQRVWRINQDLVCEIGPLEVSKEKLDLCDRFLVSRYPGKSSNAMDYYSGFFINSMTTTMEISFRLAGKLVGVSIIDVTDKSVSAVYFFFDPDYAKRSPGTFNILYLIKFAQLHHADYFYLGYWIEQVDAMRYKSRFKPHYLYQDGIWRRID